MELNGPANIKMILELMLEEKRISQADYDTLVKQAEKTIEYMIEWSNGNKVFWSQVKG